MGNVRGARQGAGEDEDQWDIYDALGTVPVRARTWEVIAPPKDGSCKIG